MGRKRDLYGDPRHVSNVLVIELMQILSVKRCDQ
jgi:hypothetical protein